MQHIYSKPVFTPPRNKPLPCRSIASALDLLRCLQNLADCMPPPRMAPSGSRSRSRPRQVDQLTSTSRISSDSSASRTAGNQPPEQQDLCHECRETLPRQRLTTLETRCCELQCAQTETIQLCIHCYLVNMNRFLTESGPSELLMPEQFEQRFFTWIFHSNRCR